MDAYKYIFDNTKFKIHEANRTKVSKDWNKVVSIYPYNRIYLVTKGSAIMMLKEKAVTLEAGFMYFLPAYNVVTSRCDDIMDHYYIHFQINPDSFTHDLTEYYKIHTKIKADSNTEQYFKLAMKHRFVNNIYDQFILDASLRLLLAPFIDYNSFNNFNHELFMPVLQYIEKNITKNITVTELADIVNLNRSYFSSMFKEVYGQSPKEYILDKKMKIAQTMLAEQKYIVKEIADYIGFDNNMYFSRIFKNKTNMTPTEYQSQFNKKASSTH